MAPCELRQQISESERAIATESLRVGDGLFGCQRNAGDTAQDRKEPRERPDVARHAHRRPLVDEAVDIAAESIDDRVDGLVRHRLTLVGAAAKHFGFDVFFELVDENGGTAWTSRSPKRPGCER